MFLLHHCVIMFLITSLCFLLHHYQMKKSENSNVKYDIKYIGGNSDYPKTAGLPVFVDQCGLYFIKKTEMCSYK